MKELNDLSLEFLWNGPEKVTRVSVINKYEAGGLKMIDLERMLESLRLVWLKRIFNENYETWKIYLQYLLRPMGGCFFLTFNYDISRETFASEREWQNIICNNKEIRIDKKKVFEKIYFESNILPTSTSCQQDLEFSRFCNSPYDTHCCNSRRITFIMSFINYKVILISPLISWDKSSLYLTLLSLNHVWKHFRQYEVLKCVLNANTKLP